jgi:hypothetical protein
MVARLGRVKPDEANGPTICPDGVAVDYVDGPRLDRVREAQLHVGNGDGQDGGNYQRDL